MTWIEFEHVDEAIGGEVDVEAPSLGPDAVWGMAQLGDQLVADARTISIVQLSENHRWTVVIVQQGCSKSEGDFEAMQKITNLPRAIRASFRYLIPTGCR